MTFHSAAEFRSYKADLGSLLVATAAQYAQNKGFAQMDEAALRQMTISIEDVAGEILMFGNDTWPESARTEEVVAPFEAAPSEVDPPGYSPALLTSIVALLFALPVAYLFRNFLGFGDYSTVHLAVVGIAAMFGTYHALLVCGSCYAFLNLFVIPPVLSFNVPTDQDIAMIIFSIIMAVTVPWFVKRGVLTMPRFSGIVKERYR